MRNTQKLHFFKSFSQKPQEVKFFDNIITISQHRRLKNSFKGLEFADFGHMPLIGSVSLKKTCQMNYRDLERQSARGRPTERRRTKSEP